MKSYSKPTVTKVDVQPDESIVAACKPDIISCKKFKFTFGS